MNANAWPDKLLTLSNVYYGRCRRSDILRAIAHLLLLVVAIMDSLHLLESYLAIVVIFVLTGCSVVLRWRIKTNFRDYRIARLRLLIVDSLALPETELDNAIYIQERINALASGSKASVSVAEYYTTKTTPGALRLKSNLACTLFFSERLYNSSRKFIDWMLAIPTLMVFAYLLAAPAFDRSSVLSINRALILLAVFLSELDIITQRLEYSRAARECGQLLAYLRQKAPASQSDLLLATGAYAAISASTPAAYGFVYHSTRRELSTLWSIMVKDFEK
jgi:uncharacterized membrane protein YhaH (DUF805 family)